MVSKVVVSAASVLLVVGVAIGVVAVVKHNNQTSLTPQMKAVQTICQSTTDKESCTKTLEPVNSDDPKKLIRAFMLATKDAVMTSYNFTTSQAQGNSGGANKAVLDYCMRVFGYALEDLETILQEMGEDLEHVGSKIDDLKQWLTSVYVYQSDCLNDIEEDDLRKTMAKGIENSKILTSNAVDIFHTIIEALGDVGIQFDGLNKTSAPAARRLLEDTAGEFPTWMSGADRKLLAKAGRGRGRGHHGGRGAAAAGIKPTFVVAKDGSGQYKTVSEAVNACPEKNPGRCIIYIKAGVYREQVVIPKKKNNVFMYGDGARKTVITYNRSVKLSPSTTTSISGTVQVESEGFMAKWIGFKNTAGPLGHQAVALRVNGDRAVVFNCRLDGYQDTLYVDSGRQFYRNCVISGTIDFIFGMSASVVQNSLIVVRKGNGGQFNTVTADGNDKGPALHVGIVIDNCRIVPDKKLAPAKLTVESYLGRPWKQYSTTVIMNSEIGDFIRPEGWTIWQGQSYHKTCTYKEYNNRGPGAATNARANWIKVAKSATEVNDFTVGNWLKPTDWIQAASVPFQL